MKRLLTFFICILCLVVCQPYRHDYLLKNQHIATACIVSKEKNENEECEYIIKNGNQYLHYFDSEKASKGLKSFDKIDGIILYFDCVSFESIKSYYDLDLFKGGDLIGYEVFYGYTPYYNDSQIINNKKINVQVAVTENEIILGFPMILTGF